MKYVVVLLAACLALASAQTDATGSEVAPTRSPIAPLFQTMLYRNMFDMNFFPAMMMANMNGGGNMFGGSGGSPMMQNPLFPLMMWKMF